MSTLKFIQKPLKIQGFRVVDFTFYNWYKELWLKVKPHKNGACCPKCNRRGKIIRTFEEPRVWRDVPVCGKEVFLVYCPREINSLRIAVFRKIFPGPLSMHGSPIGLSSCC